MKQHKYRAFIGISQKSYTITIENNGDYFVVPSKTVKAKEKYEINLLALYELLEMISKIIKDGSEIEFYTDDFDICYDWKIINQNKVYKKQIKYIEYWERIIKLIKNNKIALKINNQSFLETIGKVNKWN